MENSYKINKPIVWALVLWHFPRAREIIPIETNCPAQWTEYDLLLSIFQDFPYSKKSYKTKPQRDDTLHCEQNIWFIAPI